MSPQRLAAAATLSVLALLTACGSPTSTASQTTTEPPTAGGVELRITTDGEDEHGPSYSLGATSLVIVATADIEEWWLAVLPDAPTRDQMITDIMLQPNKWATAFPIQETDLELAPHQSVTTDDAGRLTIKIQPGTYLACILKRGHESDPRNAGRTALSGCAELPIQGDTTWTMVERSGEAGTTTINSEPTTT